MKNKNTLNENNRVSIRIAYAYDFKAPADRGWSGVVGCYDVYSAYYGDLQEVNVVEIDRWIEDKENADKKLLDEIWAGWNNGSGQECDAFRQADARSLSVGDYVEITFSGWSDYYRVERTGWNHVRRSDFQAEVDAYEASHQFAELQAHQLESDDVELRANILKEVKHLNTLPAKYTVRWSGRSYFADSIDYLVGIVFDSHRSTCREEAIKQDN